MKTLFAFLAAGMFALPLFAQQSYTAKVARRANALPTKDNGAVALPTATLDTLTQYLERASQGQPALLTFNPGQGDVPVTGTNNLYLFLGARYSVTGQPTVRGMLVAYAVNITQGEPDSLIAAVFTLNPDTGLPFQQVGGTIFRGSDIDTTALTYIGFPQPVELTTSSFAVMVQTLGLSQTTPADPADLMAIFSNSQGDGNGEDNGVFLTVQNQQLVAGFLSNLGFNPALDIDPLIMPVIETTTTDVRDAITLNGLSLHGAFPNPASDKSTVRFSLEKPSYVEINLLDMTGKTVMTVRRDNVGAGEQALDLNVAGIPAGSYLYTVRTASSALAGKMTVVK